MNNDGDGTPKLHSAAVYEHISEEEEEKVDKRFQHLESSP
jgi:hypothetical protein